MSFLMKTIIFSPTPHRHAFCFECAHSQTYTLQTSTVSFLFLTVPHSESTSFICSPNETLTICQRNFLARRAPEYIFQCTRSTIFLAAQLTMTTCLYAAVMMMRSPSHSSQCTSTPSATEDAYSTSSRHNLRPSDTKAPTTSTVPHTSSTRVLVPSISNVAPTTCMVCTDTCTVPSYTLTARTSTLALHSNCHKTYSKRATSMGKTTMKIKKKLSAIFSAQGNQNTNIDKAACIAKAIDSANFKRIMLTNATKTSNKGKHIILASHHTTPTCSTPYQISKDKNNNKHTIHIGGNQTAPHAPLNSDATEFLPENTASTYQQFGSPDLDNWLPDSGASSHYTPVFSDLCNVKSCHVPVFLADGTTKMSSFKGTIDSYFTTTEGQKAILGLVDVYYIEGLSHRLLSLTSLSATPNFRIIIQNCATTILLPDNSTYTWPIVLHELP